MTGENQTAKPNEWWVRQSHPVVDRVIDLVEPLLAAEGFELVDIEYILGAGATLRLYVDVAGRVKNGSFGTPDDGITIDQLTSLTRLLSDAMDVSDPIKSSYKMEVSSPGLDRPLARHRDFDVAVGQQVRIKTNTKIDGRARFFGELVAVENSAVCLDIEGEQLTIPTDAIAKARLKYEPAKPEKGRGRSRS